MENKPNNGLTRPIATPAADARRGRATPAEVLHRKEAALEFIMTGFKQSQNVRHYSFQIVAGDRTRRDVTVDADLDLMRRHGISIQEMPLLCKHLLETMEEARLAEPKVVIPELGERIVFTEQSMLGLAQLRATAKREQELRRRRPVVPSRTSTNPNNPNQPGKEVARAI
jgi:hypothetical protein